MAPIAPETYLKLETRAFELRDRKYHRLGELAKAMGLSLSQVYRLRQGKRGISEKFIIGALRAFPEYEIGDLFIVVPQGAKQARRYKAALSGYQKIWHLS